LQELAHALTQHALFLGEAEIHDVSPPGSLSAIIGTRHLVNDG